MEYTMTGPKGPPRRNPDVAWLVGRFAPEAWSFWTAGSGDATLRADNGHVLLILPHAVHGFCLKYSADDFRTDEWISLHDPSDLLRTVPALDDWYVSVGLFLPGDRAAQAVAHFAREGTRDPGTRWVDAAELPEGANW